MPCVFGWCNCESEECVICGRASFVISFISNVVHQIFHRTHYRCVFSPQNIPEVHLLLHFFMLGIGEDFPPDTAASSKEGRNSEQHFSFHTTGEAQTEGMESIGVIKMMLGYILPAVAQLHVLTWRAQLAEEIVARSNKIWPGITGTAKSSVVSGGSGASVVVGSATVAPEPLRRSSGGSSAAHEPDNAPPKQFQQHIAGE